MDVEVAYDPGYREHCRNARWGQPPAQAGDSSSFVIYPEEPLLGRMVVLFFISLGTSILFSTLAGPLSALK